MTILILLLVRLVLLLRLLGLAVCVLDDYLVGRAGRRGSRFGLGGTGGRLAHDRWLIILCGVLESRDCFPCGDFF